MNLKFLVTARWQWCSSGWKFSLFCWAELASRTVNTELHCTGFSAGISLLSCLVLVGEWDCNADEYTVYL